MNEIGPRAFQAGGILEANKTTDILQKLDLDNIKFDLFCYIKSYAKII